MPTNFPCGITNHIENQNLSNLFLILGLKEKKISQIIVDNPQKRRREIPRENPSALQTTEFADSRLSRLMENMPPKAVI